MRFSLLDRILRPVPVLDRAVGVWLASAYDATNTRIFDLSGRGHHAAQVDATNPLPLKWTGTNYLYLPGVSGNYLSTPDAATLDITGDIEIRARVALTDWTPAAETQLVGKWTVTGNQRSYKLSVNTNGTLLFQNSTDGAVGTVVSHTSSVAPTVSDGGTLWVRVTVDVDNGSGDSDATFYTSTDDTNDPTAVTWTQLGTVINSGGTTSIFSGTSVVTLGAIEAGTSLLMAGKLYYASILNGIGGTAALTINTHTQPTEPFSTFTDGTGKTVTINRSATGRKSTMVDRTMMLFGTDDYLEIPHASDLDLGATQPLTAIYAGRSYDTTPAAVEVLIGKKDNNNTTAGWFLYNNSATDYAVARIADGTVNPFAITGDLTAGQAFTVGLVRDVVADAVTSYQNGVLQNSNSDTTTATSANSEPVRIGADGGAAALFLDGEFFGAAVFRERLTVEEINEVGKVLLGRGR